MISDEDSEKVTKAMLDQTLAIKDFIDAGKRIGISSERIWELIWSGPQLKAVWDNKKE